MIRASLLACSLLTLLIGCATGPEDIVQVGGAQFADSCMYTGLQSANPFTWPWPAAHQSPTEPTDYQCSFYRDDYTGAPPNHWSSPQFDWPIEKCVYPPPDGKFTITWGSNVGGPADAHCVMLTAFADGSEGIIDFQYMGALGWREECDDCWPATYNWFRSIYVGPHVSVGVSDRAQVDTSSVDPQRNWICQLDSHCTLFDGGTYGLELDHEFGPGMHSPFKPWSIWWTKSN